MIRVTSIVALAGLLAVVIRTFLFLTFGVTSESMEPTLLVGDDFLLTKFSYGYSRYALPFSVPRFKGRILESQPQRGDVVVFRYPKDDRVDFVKRVVGLPGDRIQLIDDVLNINGKPVKRERVGDIVDHDEFGPIPEVRRWREMLPNGVTYTTNELVARSRPVTTRVYDVPAGHCFIIGDNRDNSRDSRDLSDIGYVPFENLIGRAQIIFLAMGNGAAAWQLWRWPTAARFGRWFTVVR
jgi:signal peptidase I